MLMCYFKCVNGLRNVAQESLLMETQVSIFFIYKQGIINPEL